MLKSRFSTIFSNLNLFGWRALGIAFFVGFVIRLVPEILSNPHPIGFDTIYYAWRIKGGTVWYNWSEVFSSWLLYGILVPVYSFIQGNPFTVLKAAAPLLFGFNTCGIYYFARKALSWTSRKALFCSLVFSFQVAALAISWEFYRNLLGLGVLLFALPFLKDVGKSARAFLLFVSLSVLVVFSHEFVAVTLFVAVFAVALSAFLKRARLETLKIIGAVTPALGFFLARIFLTVFRVSYSVPDSNVIMAYHTTGHFTGVFFFFTNYLQVSDTVQSYSSYAVLFSNVVSLFLLLFIAVLPLILIGFFRDRVLDNWVALLLVGGFGALIVPWFALDEWSRWMLMLVYPFTFYVVNGAARVIHANGVDVSPGWQRLSWLKVSKRKAQGFLIASFCMGLVFMTCPLLFGRSGLLGLPTTVNYVPSTMQSNSLPLIDVDDTVEALKWISTQINGSSAFLAQDAFYWWSRLYLTDTDTIVYFKNDFDSALATAHEHGFNTVYFVWWNTDIGWYGIAVPSYFAPLRDFGRISVYEYGSV